HLKDPSQTDRLLVTSGGQVQVLGTDTVFSTLISKYNNITTAGWGVPAIYGKGRSTAQTAAVASLATYTVGASDGSFWVSANLNVTAVTLANITVNCDYTDETNTARTLTFTFTNLTG